MAITNAIDISEYQDPNSFDYQAVKDAGVKAIIIRLGHGHTQDKYVTQHLVKAKQYGFKIAGYFYYEGTSGEVEYSLNLAKQLLDSGSYYFLDMEGNLGGDWQSQFYDFRSEWLKAGFKVGLYVSDSPYQNRFDNAKLVSDGVYRWIASYSYEPANYDMWQSGSKGGFGSYTGNVDHDYDKTGSIINFSADQPSEPDRPDNKPTPPSKDDGYIQDIVNQPGYDTETGIYGRGYSHDNGAHFYVQETIYGRKYRQEDADRLYPFLKKYFSDAGPVETSLHWADILDKPDLVTESELESRLSQYKPTAVSWSAITDKPDVSKLATKTDLARYYTKAETDSAINSSIGKVQIGGRNLVVGSDQDFVADDTANTGSQGWLFAEISLTEQPKIGDQLTVSCEGTITGKGQHETFDVVLYDHETTNAHSKPQRLTAGKRSSATLEVNNLGGIGETVLLIYAGNISDTEGKKNTIHHLKVEYGNKATDWTPAPEDFDRKLTSYYTKSEADTKLSNKVDIGVAYDKQQVNNLLANKADKSQLPDLSDYAKKSDIPSLADYVKQEELSDYAKKDDIPAPVDLSGYAKLTDIPSVAGFLKQADLLGYAKKSDIPNLQDYVKSSDLAGYAKKTDLPAPVDLTGYAKKTDLPDLTDYAKKSDLPSIPSDLVHTGDLNTLEQAVERTVEDVQTDVENAASKAEQAQTTADNNTAALVGKADKADLNGYATKDDLKKIGNIDSSNQYTSAKPSEYGSGIFYEVKAPQYLGINLSNFPADDPAHDGYEGILTTKVIFSGSNNLRIATQTYELIATNRPRVFIRNGLGDYWHDWEVLTTTGGSWLNV